jgi:glucose/arabinose dehydrogenase
MCPRSLSGVLTLTLVASDTERRRSVYVSPGRSQRMHRATRRSLLRAAGVTGAVTLAGCFAGSVDEPPTGTGEPTWPAEPTWTAAEGSPLDADVRVTTVVENLDVPWDLTFADGDAFLTERSGGIRRFDAGTLANGERLAPEDGATVLLDRDLPGRTGPGEDGTLGVASHPGRDEVFVYYTADDPLRNRVVAHDTTTGERRPAVDAIPASEWHNGGRITVDPGGDLWILTGDAQEADLAQAPDSLGGRVLRVTPDGEPAPSNPAFDDDVDPRTYTLGHRNPQGLGFTPDGEPLVAEHGPLALDEVAAVRPGANYGWDAARGGPGNVQYGSYTDHPAFTPPLVNTGSGTWAPSGAVFYTDDAIPEWRNRLFVAGLRSQTLFCVTLRRRGYPPGGIRYEADWLDDRYTATAHKLYDGEYGRLRHAAQGPDGALYLLTSNRDGRTLEEFPTEDDDRVLRVEPA